jgi:hypothetical protein
MNTKKFRAAVMVTTLTASISLAATEAAAALTVAQRSARPAAEVTLNTGNAAPASACSQALDARTVSAPRLYQAARTTPGPEASSHLSGLPYGGAADCM